MANYIEVHFREEVGILLERNEKRKSKVPSATILKMVKVLEETEHPTHALRLPSLEELHSLARGSLMVPKPVVT